MKSETHETSSDTLKGPPPAPFNTQTIFAEFYESYLHPVTKQHVTIDKICSSKSLPVAKMIGHLTEDEYRRHLRGVFARMNAFALMAESQIEMEKSTAISNGVNQDVAERLNIGRIGFAQTKDTPVTCTKTGAVYIPHYPAETETADPTSAG